MKIGIVTYHNGSNYGAALQTFALQEEVKRNNYEVEIINYKNYFIMKGMQKIRFEFSIHGIYYFMTDIFNYSARKRKIIKFIEFFKNYSLTKLYNKTELKKIAFDYDYIISGSDQIWNPLLNKGYDDIYFGNINTKVNTKKISYASSVGNYKLDDKNLNMEFKKLVESFEKISVRENSKKIGEILGKEVEQVCDPTILLNEDEWKNKLNIKETSNKYLLIYHLADEKNIIEIAQRVAELKNLEIYCICKTRKKYKNIKYFNDIGPKEFVELFYNASYIITNSFHGTAFSVNFKKQFLSIKHPKSPQRAETFLKQLGLENRLIKADDIPNDILEEELAIVTLKLEKIREKSKNFLKIGGVENR
ncbi:polysaccharide pyruvyl transferase family protein [Fusobacterium sp. SYSU M8D902]|uniref:polysaccharide pyruvyl transferase family protein n=1 Tax=Fusobacterium sp. SYSU M8D902 TaxID=3159562 RepID=UPI0032E3FCBE